MRTFDYFEDCIQLSLPKLDLNLSEFENQWKTYNPRKNIARWGLSITSLDGEMLGVPDLDSIYEYNNLNQTQFSESNFNVKTKLGQQFSNFIDRVDIGRSHIIKLGSGGFFPFHRDLDQNTFRVIYCIDQCHPNNFVWLQGDQALRLGDSNWYIINTKKAHAVFSFFGCQFAVFNVIQSEKSLRFLMDAFLIK